MNEEIKAIAELAKMTDKALDCAREVGGFISKFIVGPLEQGMGIFEDKLKYMRWERQIALIDKVNKKMSERGLDEPTQVVPMKITIPLLQAASMEEEDNLQELWANLLVNAADKECNVDIVHSFISILKELTWLDAQILDTIYSFNENVQIWTWKLPDEVVTEDPKSNFCTPLEEETFSLEVLCRLGLLEPIGLMGIRTGPGVTSVFKTTLGGRFHRACLKFKN
jgi:hypothetical protein